MFFTHFLLVTASLTLAAPGLALAQAPASAPAASLAAPASADKPAAAASPAAAVTRGEFEALLKETLMNNPDIVMQAVKKLHAKRMEESENQMREAIAKHKDALEKDTESPSVGDPALTDVTVVEFFDYHCGYCKHMLPAVTKLLSEDKKVRFIFREFPILSQDSAMAARAALAVHRLDSKKYFDFHSALMKHTGKFDEKSIADIAKKVGIDAKKLKKEMEHPEISAQLDKTRALAEEIGVRGTPAVIVGGELLPGAVPYEDLAQFIDSIRKGVKPELKSRAKASAEPAPQKPEPAGN